MRTRLPAILIGLILAACGGEEAQGPAGPPIVPSDVAYEADPRPYDPALDAQVAIDKALARARGENKRVLIKMGGNWCPDCQVLAGMMQIPQIASLLEDDYVVVKVDVGRYDKNLDVAERFGMDGFEGVPTLLVLTPDGRVLNRDEPSVFRNARDRDPQDFADYLYRYATMPAPPRRA